MGRASLIAVVVAQMQLNRNVALDGKRELTRHDVHLRSVRSRLDLVICIKVIIQADLTDTRAQRVVQRGCDLCMQLVGIIERPVGMDAHQVANAHLGTTIGGGIDHPMQPTGER